MFHLSHSTWDGPNSSEVMFWTCLNNKVLSMCAALMGIGLYLVFFWFSSLSFLKALKNRHLVLSGVGKMRSLKKGLKMLCIKILVQFLNKKISIVHSAFYVVVTLREQLTCASKYVNA